MLATLVVAALIAIIIAGVSAPYETLGWWAGWFGDTPGKLAAPADPAPADPQTRQFVIYLSGIGTTSPDAYSPLERGFLAALEQALPDARLVDDIFPYSNRNRALTGQRVFAWFWRRLARLKGRGRFGMIAFLINIRNFWQVLVSSDARFGPLYNYASSELLYGKLLAHGYRPGSGVPVVLIGYSGGGQIAVGAGPLLKQALGAPVHVISLGGVMSSSEALLTLDSLTHLYGSRDVTQRLGYIFFPQRWPLMVHSPWNRARQGGLIRRVLVGPMVHTGRGGYLDPETRLGDQSFLDRTVGAVVAALARVVEPRR